MLFLEEIVVEFVEYVEEKKTIQTEEEYTVTVSLKILRVYSIIVLIIGFLIGYIF